MRFRNLFLLFLLAIGAQADLGDIFAPIGQWFANLRKTACDNIEGMKNTPLTIDNGVQRSFTGFFGGFMCFGGPDKVEPTIAPGQPDLYYQSYEKVGEDVYQAANNFLKRRMRFR